MYDGWIFSDYEMGNISDLCEAIDKDRSLLNLRDEYGDTLLTCAINREDIKFITFLIVKGSDVNECSKDLEFPLSIALQLESSFSIPIMAILIVAGADVEFRGLDGSALHMAIKEGSLEKVTFLVDIGANIEARREDGETPVWHAASRGNFDITQYLLRKGANPTVKDHFHLKTPCQIIRDSNFHNKENLLLLFENK